MIFENRSTDQDVDLRAMIAVLRRQSRIITYTFLLVFGLAGLLLVSVTPTYTAAALIFVNPETKNILEPGRASPTSPASDNARVDSEVEILRSSAVALAVIREKELFRDPQFGPAPRLSQRLANAVGIAHAGVPSGDVALAKTLANFKRAITIQRKGLTYLISVSASAQSAPLAAEIANAMAQTYIDQQVQAKVNASLAARDVLQGQIEAARVILTGFEDRFDQFFDNNSARIFAEGHPEINHLRSDLAKNLTEVSQLAHAKSELSVLVNENNWNGVAETINSEPLKQLVAYRDRLLFTQPDQTKFRDGELLQAELRRLETQLEQQSRQALTSLTERIENLGYSASATRNKIRGVMSKADLPPDLLTEVYALQQEASIARAQHQDLLSRMHDLETQARIQIADSRIVAPALAPVSPAFPNKTLVLLVALAASAGLGVSLAFLNEFYIGGVTSPSQLSEILQANTASTIPKHPDTDTGQLSVADTVIDAPLSQYSESLRTLRAAIDQTFRTAAGAPSNNDLTPGKTILVTSSVSNEGKTTTALALARTYAIAGKKTLLLDADLRKPSLHKQLGFAPKTGFLDYLHDPENNDMNSGFYARDPASQLALIMCAGRAEVATDQLLNSSTFEELLDQAREVYDVTIIDSPPLLPVVDARYIAHQADAVVMAVKWAATGQSDLRSAIQPLRLAMKPSAALLPVLTQSETRQRGSDYDDYSDNYSAAI